jgi:hypothetical protein
MAKIRGFKLKMVSDVLLLSYLDKIGLSLTGEAGQASAYCGGSELMIDFGLYDV